jgi:hypothetical protein
MKKIKKAEIFASVYLHARSRYILFMQNEKDAEKITGIYVVMHIPGKYEKDELREWALCMQDMARWQSMFDAEISVVTYKNEEEKSATDVAWKITIYKNMFEKFKEDWEF